MNRSQLSYFLAVAEHGSFGRAAAALGMAQPSLAQAVGTLEREMGASLFHRGSGGAVPTAAGHAFTVHARQLLRGMSAAAHALAGAEAQPAGTLDVVTNPVLALDPGSVLLGEFRRTAPGVRLQVAVPERDELLAEMLSDGRAEVGLTYLPLPAGELAVEELGTHELMAVFPPAAVTATGAATGGSAGAGTGNGAGNAGVDAVYAAEGPVPVVELGAWDVVGVPGTSWQKELVGRALREAGCAPRVVVETAHREAVLPLVLAGAGMAFLTGGPARWAARQGAVVRRLEPALRQPYGLVHPPGQLSPAGSAFLEHARTRPGVSPTGQGDGR